MTFTYDLQIFHAVGVQNAPPPPTPPPSRCIIRLQHSSKYTQQLVGFHCGDVNVYLIVGEKHALTLTPPPPTHTHTHSVHEARATC